MLNVDKSKWKPLVKEDDKIINKLKVELLELYKEFYETTGDDSLFNFLNQSFAIVGECNPKHFCFKISDDALIEYNNLGYYLLVGTRCLWLDNLFSKCITPNGV